MPPRQPKKNANQLSDADIAILQQARAAQNSLASLGIPSPMPEPKQIENTIELPPTQPQGYTSTSDVIKDYDNFIELTGLPSGGRFYNAPIYGQPLKVTDILQIQNVDESNVNQRFSEIFSRRFRGIDPYEILVADEILLSEFDRGLH